MSETEYKPPEERYAELSDEELLERWEDGKKNEPSGTDPHANRGAWIAMMNTLGWELSKRGILQPFHADFFREFSKPEFDPYEHIRETDDPMKRKAALDALREAMEEYGLAMYRRGLRVGRGEEVRQRDKLSEVSE